MKRLITNLATAAALSLIAAASINAQSTPSAQSPAPVSKVNINTATLVQLCYLPGVGAKTAATIIDYRTEHGQFHRASDLLQVRGFGAKRLAKLIPYVVTAGPTTATGKVRMVKVGGAK